MNLPGRIRAQRSAMTLIETMIALAMSTTILGVLFVSLFSLQRNFTAVEAYATSQGNQARVSDYISADLRRALNVSVVSNVLTVNIPDYYNTGGPKPAPGATPVTPTVVNNLVTYAGGASIAIRYYQQGNAFYRSVNNVATVIANDVADFQVTLTDNINTATCTTVFSPRFTATPSAGAIAGTQAFTKVYLRNSAARN